MQQPKFDPGLTQQYTGRIRRAINPDGSMNVLRRGTNWRDVHPYLHLVSVSWAHFFGLVLAVYVVVNLFFATLYYALGPDALSAGVSNGSINHFLRAVFFSSQTLTTVGFGAIYPKSIAANLLAAIEAFAGLLGFAVATGLLFGRVARPSARIGFSEKALIAPYQDGQSLQFRIVNRRSNNLMELEATVTLMRVLPVDGVLQRSFDLLALERAKVMFLALTWTIVHPIDPTSPLYGKTAEDLSAIQAEIIITIKAWDETFSQTVYQRYSYRASEIAWGKFKPAFRINEAGDMELEVSKVGLHEPIAAAAVTAGS